MKRDYSWVGLSCIVFYSAIGIGCLLVGGHLAIRHSIEEIREGPPSPPPQTVTVQKVERDHPANWGAAEGFAMAGGLCLIAAALAFRGLPSGQLAQGKVNEAPTEEEYSRAFRRR
jgi:hypothetical protein